MLYPTSGGVWKKYTVAQHIPQEASTKLFQIITEHFVIAGTSVMLHTMELSQSQTAN